MSARPSPPLRRRARTAAIAICALAGVANANPRPLPYTYIYETLPKGEAEVELYTDLTSLRAVNPNGAPAWYLGPQFQAEIEYGLTDRLELGLYLTIAPSFSGVWGRFDSRQTPGSSANIISGPTKWVNRRPTTVPSSATVNGC